jgi:membrane associated rhomboid family serine protease
MNTIPNLHDGLVLVAAAGFALMGAGSILAPLAVTRQFDVPTLTPAGRNEVRAVYGGFGLAISAMLVLVLWTPELRPGVCLTIAAALGGMAGGRLLSALIDRELGRLPFLYLCLETLGAALLVYAAAGRHAA